MLSVDNMNTKVSGRESLNGALPNLDAISWKLMSSMAQNPCEPVKNHAAMPAGSETADRTFIDFS